MYARRFFGAATAALALMLALPVQARRLCIDLIDLVPLPHANAMVDDRFAHLRLPEAYASARARDDRDRPSRSSSHKPMQPRPASAGFFMRRI